MPPHVHVIDQRLEATFDAAGPKERGNHLHHMIGNFVVFKILLSRRLRGIALAFYSHHSTASFRSCTTLSSAGGGLTICSISAASFSSAAPFCPV